MSNKTRLNNYGAKEGGPLCPRMNKYFSTWLINWAFAEAAGFEPAIALARCDLLARQVFNAISIPVAFNHSAMPPNDREKNTSHLNLLPAFHRSSKNPTPLFWGGLF